MQQDDFWQLVRSLGPDPGDADFERLTGELATRSPEDIIGFEDRLAALLYALDTPAHAAAARAHNDWFLYVRCAGVAAGRGTYEEILAQPAKLRRFASREAEHLLSVASGAYERSTGMLWEHQTPVSYESGSNTAAWGEPEPIPDAAGEPPGPRSWLILRSVIFLPDGWPAAYDRVVDHVGQALAADPAWQAWWEAAGIPECHLWLYLQAEEMLGPPGTTVKVGRERVEATLSQQPAPFPSTEPAELLPRVVADVTSTLDAVRDRLGLPPLPPLSVPDLPADLPQGTQHPETFGELFAGVGARSILKALVFALIGRFRRRRRPGQPKP